MLSEPDGAVITVPAYFDDAQRQSYKDAARLVGLEVLRLLMNRLQLHCLWFAKCTGWSKSCHL